MPLPEGFADRPKIAIGLGGRPKPVAAKGAMSDDGITYVVDTDDLSQYVSASITVTESPAPDEGSPPSRSSSSRASMV